jgi:hypothetical protein
MGSFDSIWFKDKKGEDIEIQFKSGECIQNNYEIGDAIDIPDGIHFEFDSVFVISNKKLNAAFHKDDNVLWDKWGRPVPFPDLNDANPLVASIKAMSEAAQHQSLGSDKWISVEDRLPEIEADYICCLQNGNLMVLSFNDGFFGELDEDDDEFVISSHSDFVTHWQPLPVPPTATAEQDNPTASKAP